MLARNINITDSRGNIKSLQMAVISFQAKSLPDIDSLYRALILGKEIAVYDVSFQQFECEREGLLLVDGSLCITIDEEDALLSMPAD